MNPGAKRTTAVHVLFAGVAVAALSCVPGVESNDFPFGGNVPPPPRLGTPPSLVDVVEADRPPPAISGGTLQVLGDGITAVASDPDRDTIYVADLVPGTVRVSHALSPGAEPGRVVEDGSGRVHVLLRGAGALLTLAPGSFAALGQRPVCAAPRGITWHRGADVLVVACAGGELVTLASDPAVAAPLRTLKLERDLRDVVVRGEDLMVSRFRAAEILVVGPDGQVKNRLSPSRGTDFGPVPGDDRASIEQRTTKPGVAWRMVPLRTGEVLVAHQLAVDRPIKTEAGGYAGTFCGAIVQAGVSVVPGSGKSAYTLGDAALPVDLAVHPSGNWGAAIAAGNFFGHGQGQVFYFDLAEVEQGASHCGRGGVPPGAFGGNQGPPRPAPDAGVAGDAGVGADGGVPPEMEEPIEAREPAGHAVAIAFAQKGHVVVQTREPAALEILTAGRKILLSLDSRADSGHAVFHANASGGLACASCHPEGGDDGRVWHFADVGPRRTQSLRGGILATAPFHWNGDLKDMGHLMTEVFATRMSGASLSPAHHRAVARFVDSIPLVAQGTPADPEAVARGKALFEDPVVGCATCHGGSLATDNRTVDVGTGRAIQVPSLRGVAARAPYMHDGCAPTLAARFAPGACSGGDRHGRTSHLSPAEIANLTAYLETL